MHNSGDKTYNVSYVGAHLHSPYDQVRWRGHFSLPPSGCRSHFFAFPFV
jgi:hypothetical protein